MKIGDLLRVTSAVHHNYGPNHIKDPPGWAIVVGWHNDHTSLPSVHWLKPKGGPEFLNPQVEGDAFTVVTKDSDAPDEAWGLYYAYQLVGDES